MQEDSSGATEVAGTAAGAVESASAAADHADFSLIGLFFQADVVVKAVMIILLLASLWSWAVIIEKWISLAGAKAKAKKFEQGFWTGQAGLVDDRPDADGGHPMARVYQAASREFMDVRRSVQAGDAAQRGLLERASRAMRAAVEREVGKAQAGLSVLASIASAAPFIGLFGTVWGIMNSFRSIAEQEEANLAVVAPGISEALLATALGLVAAIPAQIFFNKLMSDANQLGERMDVFSEDVVVRLSRRMAEGGV